MSRLRFGLALLYGALILVSSVTARQPADLLKQTRERLAVEAQRVEQDARTIEQEARRLARTDPAAGAIHLRRALTLVQNDQAMSPEKREGLLRSLQASLRIIENIGAATPGRDPGRPAFDDTARREQDQINTTQQQIRQLQATGKSQEARALADDLARRFPNNPAVQAGRVVNSRTDNLADARFGKTQRSEGVRGTLQGVDQATIPPSGDIEFTRDPDLRARQAKRTVGPAMTATERAILTELNRPIIVDFDNENFKTVIATLEKTIGQPIIVEKAAMEEANVLYTTPVTCKATASTRSILRKILSELGLAYTIREQSIQITTIARAKENLTTRAYYIGDLAAVVDVRLGPALTQLAELQNVNALMLQITQGIDPQSWKANNDAAGGTIAYDPLSKSIIIRQTAEVHFMLGVGLR